MTSVTIVGNIVADAEVKYTSNGTPVMNYTLAENLRYKDQEESHFYNCVTFGTVCEALGQYMTKGKKIGATGELRHKRWEKDGVKHSNIEMHMHKIELLSRKDE